MKRKLAHISILNLSLLIVLLSFGNSLSGQNTVLDFNYKLHSNKHSYQWNETSEFNKVNPYGHGLQIGITKNIYKDYFLRFNIGTNNIHVHATSQYQYMILTALVTEYYEIEYKRSIVQLDILPSYRFGFLRGKDGNNMLLLNAGISILGNDLEKTIYTTLNPDGTDPNPVIQNSFIVNTAFKAGLDYHFLLKKYGFHLGIGYNYIPPYYVALSEAQIDTHQINFTMGISYLFN